ncbi:MAG: Rrf2 family transcriptional regulator [Fibrobacteres bacterium]|jgi:Rrf2 family protein|nr:Rrf2 family transcriptional regulator [Fibrobacterota bacterium]
MKFTKKTDYALRTMQFLARQWYGGDEDRGGEPRPVPVQQISEHCHLSFRFLHGIVSKLSKARLLRTLPGPKGGIMLARDPEFIPILEIVEAVEGRINLMECLEHPEHCDAFQGCSIMSVMHGAQVALVQSLANTNLKLMVRAKQDPFNRVPEKHFLKPQFGCPVLK